MVKPEKVFGFMNIIIEESHDNKQGGYIAYWEYAKTHGQYGNTSDEALGKLIRQELKSGIYGAFPDVLLRDRTRGFLE